MKTTRPEHALPTDFSSHPYSRGGITAEFDVKVTHRSRLKLKVLVFKSQRELRRIWNKLILGGVGSNCRGIVNPLIRDISRLGTDGKWAHVRSEADPNYFSVMGLIRGQLHTDIIVHESVHAAINYSRRVKGLWPDKENPDEHLCYPAGIIAAEINKALHKKKLYNL